MKFIFPQNYNFKTKLFGMLDYPTAIFNLVWWILVYVVIKIFCFDLLTKIIIFITLCFPVFLVSLFGFHQENIIYVLGYLVKFYRSRKIYLYKK